VQVLPLVILVAVLAVRLLRPQKISITRMWVSPIVLCGLSVWVIYLNERLNPAPPAEIALGIVLGAILGTPLGILRGMHTEVKLTEKRGVMYLGSSWVTVAIFLVAFGLRYAVRLLMPQHGSLTGIIGDAVLAFAIAFIAASYVVIFRKYERLDNVQT
jgi:hypothetical protein